MARHKKSLDEVVWPKIKKTEHCWQWIGAKNMRGYGFIHRDGKHISAHRVVWEMLRGRIPSNLTLHHKCHNHSCVNPDCMELVSTAEHAKIHHNLSRSRLESQQRYIEYLEARLNGSSP